MKTKNVELYLNKEFWKEDYLEVIRKALDELSLSLEAKVSIFSESDKISRKGIAYVTFNGRDKDGGHYHPKNKRGPSIYLGLTKYRWVKSEENKMWIPNIELKGIEKLNSDIFKVSYEHNYLKILNKSNLTQYIISGKQAIERNLETFDLLFS